MSQLEVKILHQDYLLTCPEGQEAQLLEAAERVDSQLEHMRQSGKIRSRERLGVLLAINLAYENLELRAQLKSLQEQLLARDWQEPQSAITEEELIALASLQSQQIRDAEIASSLIAKIDNALSEHLKDAAHMSSDSFERDAQDSSTNAEFSIETNALTEVSEPSVHNDSDNPEDPRGLQNSTSSQHVSFSDYE